MSTGVAVCAFALGALVSLATSWLLVTRLERVGERLGFSEALLGLVAALAADAPEITSSVTALVHHERAVGAGITKTNLNPLPTNVNEPLTPAGLIAFQTITSEIVRAGVRVGPDRAPLAAIHAHHRLLSRDFTGRRQAGRMS